MVSVLPPPTELTTDSTSRSRIAEALAAIPGVDSVGSSMAPLLSPDGWGSAIEATVEGAQVEALPVFYNYVTPDFLRTFGVRLLAGRSLNDTDIQRPVAIVNQRLAERFGVAADSIVGRSISFGFYTLEVAGVVSDVRFGDVTSDIEPQILMPPPEGTIWVGPATFYVRSARPPKDLLPAVRETVARVDPTRPIANLHTVEQQLRASIATERFLAGASTAFAVLATALAALGLYGVLAYSVAQRAREIGLRVALGAPVARIRRMVLRQTAGIAVVGIVVGAIAASMLGRAARSLLFGVEGSDPLAFAAAVAVLTAVMLGATHVPARRAARVDPMKVLRYE